MHWMAKTIHLFFQKARGEILFSLLLWVLLGTEVLASPPPPNAPETKPPSAPQERAAEPRTSPVMPSPQAPPPSGAVGSQPPASPTKSATYSKDAEALFKQRYGLQLDPRLMEEMVFAAPPPNCSQYCMEAIASILYESAMRFRRFKYTKMAQLYLQQILLHYSTTRAAKLAQLQLVQWDTVRESVKDREQWWRSKKPVLDQRGRLEFIITSSLGGIFLGVGLPIAFNNSTATVIGLSILGFLALGVTASILGTMNAEMTPGQGSIAGIGLLWGTMNFGMIAGLARAGVEDSFRLILVGAVLGYAAGTIVPRFFKPTAGQVTMGASLGAWLMGYTGGIFAMASWNNPQVLIDGLLVGMMIAGDLGLAGGMWLGSVLNWSRNRILFINLGGVVSAAVGMSILLIANANLGDPLTWGLTNILSSIIGMTVTILLTNGMRSESEEEKQYLAVGSLVHYERGRWSAGMPIPTILPDTTRPQAGAILVNVPLVQGRW